MVEVKDYICSLDSISKTKIYCNLHLLNSLSLKQFILKNYIELNDWQVNWAPAKKAIKIISKYISRFYEQSIIKLELKIGMSSSSIIRERMKLRYLLIYITNKFWFTYACFKVRNQLNEKKLMQILTPFIKCCIKIWKI